MNVIFNVVKTQIQLRLIYIATVEETNNTYSMFS